MSIEEMIAAVVAHSAKRPMWEIMREYEVKAGNSVVVPGDTPWLSAEDWDPTIVVSRRGNEVRLIAILALKPHTGAFRRTVAGIMAVGLTPVVIEPLGEMTAILTRWNWSRRIVGSGFMDREEQWRPRRQSPRPEAMTVRDVVGAVNLRDARAA